MPEGEIVDTIVKFFISDTHLFIFCMATELIVQFIVFAKHISGYRADLVNMKSNSSNQEF